MLSFAVYTILILAAASAAAGEFVLLARSHARLRVGWRNLRSAGALRRISRATIDTQPSRDVLGQLLPALSALTGTVTAVWIVAPAGKRSRVRVSSPPNLREEATRSATALLAASSLVGDEDTSLALALSSGRPQRGADLGALLRAGGSALPDVTRDRLQMKLRPMPYLIVPIQRAGRVVGVLLAIVSEEKTDTLDTILSRAATRLAMAFAFPEENGRWRRPAHTANRRRLPPRDAEIVLWMDPQGGVVACEPLQDDWLLDPPPTSLAGIVMGPATAPALMDRAQREGEIRAEVVRLPDGTPASLTLVALSDIDGNLWGYAALLRRLGVPNSASIPEIIRVAQ